MIGDFSRSSEWLLSVPFTITLTSAMKDVGGRRDLGGPQPLMYRSFSTDSKYSMPLSKSRYIQGCAYNYMICFLT